MSHRYKQFAYKSSLQTVGSWVIVTNSLVMSHRYKQFGYKSSLQTVGSWVIVTDSLDMGHVHCQTSTLGKINCGSVLASTVEEFVQQMVDVVLEVLDKHAPF